LYTGNVQKSVNVKLTTFVVVMALLSLENAQLEKSSRMGKSADKLIEVTCYTV